MAIENKSTLLLSGPQHYDTKRPATSWVRRYYENLPPLGIAIVSSILKEHGIQTNYKVMNPDKLSDLEPAIEHANSVWISARHYDTSLAQEVVETAKTHGKTVIVGGYAPTFSPEKFDNADAIVRGELEPIAPELMDDFLNKQLHHEYDATQLQPFDMQDYTWPDRTIFPKQSWPLDKLKRHPQEWQRGCYNKCDFCSPTRLQKGGIRVRKTSDIIAEIESINLKPGDHLFSTDLNTSAIPQNALYELFGYLKQNGIRWYTEGAVAPLLENLEQVGHENSLLHLMSAGDGIGGCYSFLYGADDLVREKVRGSSDKKLSLLRKAVRVFREMGVPLNLSVMVGLDNHKYPDTFFTIAQTVQELQVPYTFVHIATPYPKTPWGEKVQRDNRIIDIETTHYNHRRVVATPKNMSPEELQQGYYWLLKIINTPLEITSTARANFDPRTMATNPTLGIIQSGLPWGIETHLTSLELLFRGHIDKSKQKELDSGYKNWLSGNH